jgi:hypothetical protein
METYNFKLKIEGNDSIVLTTEKADNAYEAKQKVLERYGRLYRESEKEITIISVDPSE